MSEMSSLIANPLNDSQSEQDSEEDQVLIRKDVTSESEFQDEKNPLMDSEDGEQSDHNKQLSLQNDIENLNANLREDSNEIHLQYHVCQTQLVWDRQSENKTANPLCSCDELQQSQYSNENDQQQNGNHHQNSQVIKAFQQDLSQKEKQIILLKEKINELEKQNKVYLLRVTKSGNELAEQKKVNSVLNNENKTLKNELTSAKSDLQQVILAFKELEAKQNGMKRSKTSTELNQELYLQLTQNGSLNDKNFPPISPHDLSIQKITSNSEMPPPFSGKSAQKNQIQDESTKITQKQSFQSYNQQLQKGEQYGLKKENFVNNQKSLQDLIHKVQQQNVFRKSNTYQMQKVSGIGFCNDLKFLTQKPLHTLVKVQQSHQQV